MTPTRIIPIGLVSALIMIAPLTHAGSGPGRQTDSACGILNVANCGSIEIDGTSDCRWVDKAQRLGHCDVTLKGTVLATNWISEGSMSARISGFRCSESDETSWLAVSGVLTFSCSFSTGVWFMGPWEPCVWWNTQLTASFTGLGPVPRTLHVEGGPRSCLS